MVPGGPSLTDCFQVPRISWDGGSVRSDDHPQSGSLCGAPPTLVDRSWSCSAYWCGIGPVASGQSGGPHRLSAQGTGWRTKSQPCLWKSLSGSLEKSRGQHAWKYPRSRRPHRLHPAARGTFPMSRCLRANRGRKMTGRRVLILLAMICAAMAQPVQAIPGFRPLPAASAEQQNYLKARVMAVALVREAMPSLNARGARLGARVISALGKARFLASTDAQSRRTCSARRYSLFVNAYFRNTIFICDEVRSHARHANQEALNRIAQGFVHEAVHLTGELDECVATRFEVMVMDRTIGVQSQGSRYRSSWRSARGCRYAVARHPYSARGTYSHAVPGLRRSGGRRRRRGSAPARRASSG